jgi:hypothetical protein
MKFLWPLSPIVTRLLGGNVDKSRYDNRSERWRKRTGVHRRRARLVGGIPKRLISAPTAAIDCLRDAAAQPSSP